MGFTPEVVAGVPGAANDSKGPHAATWQDIEVASCFVCARESLHALIKALIDCRSDWAINGTLVFHITFKSIGSACRFSVDLSMPHRIHRRQRVYLKINPNKH